LTSKNQTEFYSAGFNVKPLDTKFHKHLLSLNLKYADTLTFMNFQC